MRTQLTPLANAASAGGKRILGQDRDEAHRRHPSNARAAPCRVLGSTPGVAVEGDGYGGVLRPFMGCLEVGVPREQEAVHIWKDYAVG